MSNLPATLPMKILGTLTTVSWELPILSVEEATESAKWLGRVGKAWQFWAGDLINRVEALPEGSQALTALEEAVGEENMQTLINAAWVARTFPPTRRHANLSYSHHLLVARLEPEVADVWLQTAENAGLSVRGLKKALKEAREKDGTARHRQVKCRKCLLHCGEATIWDALGKVR